MKKKRLSSLDKVGMDSRLRGNDRERKKRLNWFKILI